MASSIQCKYIILAGRLISFRFSEDRTIQAFGRQSESLDGSCSNEIQLLFESTTLLFVRSTIGAMSFHSNFCYRQDKYEKQLTKNSARIQLMRTWAARKRGVQYGGQEERS